MEPPPYASAGGSRTVSPRWWRWCFGGAAIGAWLLLAVVYDAAVLMTALHFADYPLERPMLGLMLANPIDLSRLMRGRLTLTGSTLRARDAEEKARLAEAVETTLWPWASDGRIRPVVDRVFPLEEAAAAHAHLEAGSHTGKVVLTT